MSVSRERKISAANLSLRKARSKNCVGVTKKLDVSHGATSRNLLSVRYLPAHCGTPFRMQKRGITEPLQPIQRNKISKESLIQCKPNEILNNFVPSEKSDKHVKMEMNFGSKNKELSEQLVDAEVTSEFVSITNSAEPQTRIKTEEQHHEIENSSRSQNSRQQSHSKERSRKLFRQIMG